MYFLVKDDGNANFDNFVEWEYLNFLIFPFFWNILIFPFFETFGGAVFPYGIAPVCMHNGSASIKIGGGAKGGKKKF